MYQARVIDLSDYKSEDLIFSRIQGGVLNITTEGSPSITLKGRNSEINADFTLAAINMGTLEKSNSISGAGAFLVPCIGLEKVTLTVSGTGKIKVKELS